MKLLDFLRNEDGAITVDWTVLVAGIMGLGLVVTSEVAYGVEKNVTDDYAGITTGKGMIAMFANSPQETTDVADPTDETEEIVLAGAGDSGDCDGANPGNDKCVGNAGESPNGRDFGGGSNGMSDGNNGNNSGGRGGYGGHGGYGGNGGHSGYGGNGGHSGRGGYGHR